MQPATVALLTGTNLYCLVNRGGCGEWKKDPISFTGVGARTPNSLLCRQERYLSTTGSTTEVIVIVITMKKKQEKYYEQFMKLETELEMRSILNTHKNYDPIMMKVTMNDIENVLHCWCGDAVGWEAL